MLLALAALAPSVAAALPFTVDSTVDDPDQDPGDGACLTAAGDCTLRAAVQEANASSAPDVIALPEGTYFLSIGTAGDATAASGDLDLEGTLTLELAPGASGPGGIVVDAGGLYRVFDVAAGADVVIEGLTVRNGATAAGEGGGGVRNRGTLELSFCDVHDNEAVLAGGGVLNLGSLTVSASTIRANSAASTQGGGIASRTPADGADVSVRLEQQSSVSGNEAHAGAGLSNRANHDALARLVVRDSSVRGNQATVVGGGIWNRSSAADGLATLVLERATVAGNLLVFDEGLSGGGIRNEALTGGRADLFATNSTLSGNLATSGNGGALAQSEDDTSIASAHLANVTVTENAADGAGGGLWGDGGLFPRNSIVAANSNRLGTGDPDCAFFAMTSQGYNLIGDLGSCSGTTTTDTTGAAAQLGALDFNGGPTRTHLPEPTSPAIDGGDPAGCTNAESPGLVLTQDQRGEPRPESEGGRCDVGAVEVVPEPGATALAAAALAALGGLARRRGRGRGRGYSR